MQLSRAATIMHGVLQGSDCLFSGVSIDSRQTSRGDLFVAIPGAQHDGHRFVDQASENGAVGALVSHTIKSCKIESHGGRKRTDQIPTSQIRVENTTVAMGQLGAHWRNRFDIPVLAITGSNGKTTVCTLIASILNQVGNCLSPRGSFNNQWGVPLTLLRIREAHTHAVIEMGMNHPGEIEYLAGLARPTIALINNVAPAHLAGLGSLQNIARAKAEIFSGLKRKGIAVLNEDDPFHDFLLRRIDAGHLDLDRVLSFGMRNSADVSVRNIFSNPDGSEFELNIEGQSINVKLPLLGQHNVMNALAAAAATHAAGAEINQIKAGLESFTAVKGRLRRLPGINGSVIIDDSYNANPASIKAALEALAGFDGKRIVVLGAMAELGSDSDELHYQAGVDAHRCGVDRLVCLGTADSTAMSGYARGFGPQAKQFSDLGKLLEYLVPMLQSGMTVLVKGSRSSAMERVVEGLVAKPGGASAGTQSADAELTTGGPSC